MGGNGCGFAFFEGDGVCRDACGKAGAFQNTSNDTGEIGIDRKTPKIGRDTDKGAVEIHWNVNES